VEQAKRFKELEKENTRLKKLVADLSFVMFQTGQEKKGVS
jgi:hypothetical protein